MGVKGCTLLSHLRPSGAHSEVEPTANGLCHLQVLVSALEVVVRDLPPRSDLILDFQRQRSGGKVVVERKPFLRSAALGLGQPLEVAASVGRQQ